MKDSTKKSGFIPAVFIFIALPMLFYVLGDFPRRNMMKESFSVLTILAFSLMLAQFFITRTNKSLLRGYAMRTIIGTHKAIGYIFGAILLIHPVLVVVPRFFESGVTSQDAFITIITTVNSQGIILGMISWFLMLLLVVTSFMRNRLNMTYKTWRITHGVLAIACIVTSSWHVIDLGRHISLALASYIILVAIAAVLLLLKTYIRQSPLTCEVNK